MFHVKHNINYSQFSSLKEVLSLFKNNESTISAYVDQLLWWNKRVNLVSRDVSRETVEEHVVHSLIISMSELFKANEYFIDAGSGGGLPGVPLSITNPNKKVLLNDIVSKKIMACKQMILKLGIENCLVEAGSIRDIKLPEGAVVISKHAFKVNDLIKLLRNKPWSGVILLKGLNEVEQELKGIEEKLFINIFSLEHEGNSFYDGKALVEITR